MQNFSKLGHLKYWENVPDKALEQWEKKLANCKVTPQAIWPIAKSLIKRARPKAPSAIHGPLNHIFYLIDKANIVADCLENQFTVHALCDCEHRQQLEAELEVLLTAAHEHIPVNFCLCDVSKEIQFFKLE
jgi:hypothetical protein